MKTREQWQAETKVIRDMAEIIWKASIPFEEEYLATRDTDWADTFHNWEQQLLRTYGEMIDMANDRDCEDEDYPAFQEISA
jgi:hypothetical protein